MVFRESRLGERNFVVKRGSNRGVNLENDRVAACGLYFVHSD